jgi:hypothetical protein
VFIRLIGSDTEQLSGDGDNDTLLNAMNEVKMQEEDYLLGELIHSK